jgi:WD40 repeat protein
MTLQGGGTSLESLAFYGSSHLISGGGDGELCIWRSSDWECLLRMKGHKGAVYDVAIHPSGRAALSVAADCKLMLWNLTTGAAVRKLLACGPAALHTACTLSGTHAPTTTVLTHGTHTGKCNYTSALAEASRLIAWAPGGEAYLYASRRALQMYDLRSGMPSTHQANTMSEGIPFCRRYMKISCTTPVC